MVLLQGTLADLEPQRLVKSQRKKQLVYVARLLVEEAGQVALINLLDLVKSDVSLGSLLKKLSVGLPIKQVSQHGLEPLLVKFRGQRGIRLHLILVLFDCLEAASDDLLDFVFQNLGQCRQHRSVELSELVLLTGLFERVWQLLHEL